MAAAYAALVSVMTVMDNLKLHPNPPISLHLKQAESLTQNLTFLEEFVKIYDQTLPYSTEADPFESRIADAAYAAEDAIESHIADGEGSDASLYEALEKVIEEMALMQKEAMEIEETMAVGVQHQPMPLYPLRSSSVVEKRSMVGADDLLLQMKEKLVAGRRDRQIIPIVGMGGAGKTTLAMNVYQDSLIKERFYVRAWATISQQYSIREILVELLSQLIENFDRSLSEDKLGEILHKHMFGRKYLIVMDDMWSIGAWDGIRRFLPDNKNGSKIVITTRLSDLASELTNSSSIGMKLLDEFSSWELLSKTVFGEETCPPELEDIGKNIGKSCKGLPLSIVVVGGFLAKSERTREFWEHIEENLSIIVNLEDDECCLKILHMSYKQLPIYLKPLFLYMGLFPEDDVIRISKLVKLWVGEGFIKPVGGGRTMEEMARGYLKELANRNLVLINEMGVLEGIIKSCKIHDLLRELCLREAEKERFYTLTPQGIVNGQRRIVISKNEDISALSSMSPFRSLIWNLKNEELPPLSLRLLRILDSPRYHPTKCPKFEENLHQLVNARFLQFSTPKLELEFPSSMWKSYWNLQTLIVRSISGSFTAPVDIWYMPKIRHLLFYCGIHLPDPPKDQDGVVLGNLQTLVASNFKCSDQVAKRIPNIKKLKSTYYPKSPDDDRDCLINFDGLDKLESLDYNICRGVSIVNFPHSLKKLCLYMSGSEYWEHDLLDKIGSLPFLEKLELRCWIFKDGQWETTEGQFRSLKFLYLSRNLRVWTIESSHFPCLSHLYLYELMELEEIPLDFAEVSTLRVIDVDICSDSVVVSAKRILEEYEDLHGDGDLQVQVTLWRTNNVQELESLRGPNFHVKRFQPDHNAEIASESDAMNRAREIALLLMYGGGE